MPLEKIKAKGWQTSQTVTHFTGLRKESDGSLLICKLTQTFISKHFLYFSCLDCGEMVKKSREQLSVRQVVTEQEFKKLKSVFHILTSRDCYRLLSNNQACVCASMHSKAGSVSWGKWRDNANRSRQSLELNTAKTWSVQTQTQNKMKAKGGRELQLSAIHWDEIMTCSNKAGLKL